VDLGAGLDDLEKRKFLTLPGLELRPLGRPARKLVAIPTTLSRLLTYLLTYLRSSALLEEPPIVQPLKNFPVFYGTP
jgi:hypothetical protein